MASAVTARRITHLLVLDFEATCGFINGVDIKAAAGNQEIIEVRDSCPSFSMTVVSLPRPYAVPDDLVQSRHAHGRGNLP
jgi:hypothetical protein